MLWYKLIISFLAQLLFYSTSYAVNACDWMDCDAYYDSTDSRDYQSLVGDTIQLYIIIGAVIVVIAYNFYFDKKFRRRFIEILIYFSLFYAGAKLLIEENKILVILYVAFWYLFIKNRFSPEKSDTEASTNKIKNDHQANANDEQQTKRKDEYQQETREKKEDAKRADAFAATSESRSKEPPADNFMQRVAKRWVILLAVAVGLFFAFDLELPDNFLNKKLAVSSSKSNATESGAGVSAQPQSKRYPTELELRNLRDSVSTALSLNEHASGYTFPDPIFTNDNARQEYSKWLTRESKRLQVKLPDLAGRKEFLQTVWYESRRAGHDPTFILNLIDSISGFRKFYLSKNYASGYMGISREWSKLLTNNSKDRIFEAQLNIRFGCVILGYYLDNRMGDLELAVQDYREGNQLW